MEINRVNRKGQVFVIAAVLFASLTVILFMTTSDISPEKDSGVVKKWFENSFQKVPKAFNGALEQEDSTSNARNHLYSYSRFVERRSKAKGVEFQAGYLTVFPGDGEAVFINYQDSSTNLDLEINSGWTNTTVGPDQHLEQSYTPGETDFRVVLPEHDIDQNFTASNPRVFSWMKMTGSDQIWINSGLN